MKIGIITCSDRASAGLYQDESGSKIAEYLKQHIVSEYEVVYYCIPDDIDKIQETIMHMVKINCGLILTTGGTGPSYRDNIPIVMKQILDKELPGFGEQMRQVSLKYVPTAILSAQTAGIIYDKHDQAKGSLVLNLPGSPKSIPECLDAVFGAIPYCVELCGGGFIETNPPAFRGKRK